MSKKSFYKISWKEIGFLLVADFAILGIFGYKSIVTCIQMPNVIIVSPYLTCGLQFLWNIGSLATLFVAVLVANFILSGFCHFVVKK